MPAFANPCVFLFTLLAMAFILVAAQKPTKTLCALPYLVAPDEACHATFATKYYQNNFTAVDWKFKFISSNEGENGPTTKHWVRSWLNNGDGSCDLLVGPGYSSIAAALSPLVEVPWVDFAATSTELSDKESHPSFSRVVPTDAGSTSSIGKIFSHFGWNSLNILCTDEPYGRSLVAGVTETITAINGTVEVSRCFPTGASEDTIRTAVNELLESKTKLVFIASTQEPKWITHLIKIVKETKANENLIFFFGEAFCSSSQRDFSKISEALCASYTIQTPAIQPFLDAMRSQDRSDELNALAALGYPAAAQENCRTVTSSFSAFSHDAALFGMAALTRYEEELLAGKTAEQLGSKIKYIRNFTKHGGATGSISLDINGDRAGIDLVVYNSVAENSEQTVGFVLHDGFQFASPQPQVTLLGASSTEIPQVSIPETPAPPIVTTSDNKTTIIVASVVPVVCVLAIVAALLVFVVLAPKQRNNVAAPKDADKPFTIVFTDIQSSTALWAREPVTMSDAVELHHTLIRELIAKHNGYEVKTIGDSFMVAFCDCKAAVDFSLAIQTTLHATTWPGNELDVAYMELLAEAGVKLPKNYEELWNGIRVRVGVHHGIGSIQEDPTTHGIDYYGSVVNTAARVESVGHGGQVLVTGSVLKELGECTGLHVVDVGAQTLRGLDEPVQLYQLTDKAAGPLLQRTFPPLRLEMDMDPADLDDGASTVLGDEYSQTASNVSGGSTVQVRAEKLASKGTVSTAQHNHNVDELLMFQQYTKVLFSTTKEDYRCKTIAHLATKWRVSNVSQKSLHTSEKEYDCGMLEVVAKALHAAKRKYRQESTLGLTTELVEANASLSNSLGRGNTLAGSSSHPQHRYSVYSREEGTTSGAETEDEKVVPIGAVE